MRKMCRHRNSGHSAILLPLLRESDTQYFYDYMRMLPATFDKLLSLVENSIRRRDTNWREWCSVQVINWDQHRLDQLHTASTTVRKAVLAMWFQPLTENDTTAIPMILRRLCPEAHRAMINKLFDGKV
ncbi:protein ANTAGONIST OF LIKE HETEROCHROMATIN PROTEIN 1-like isoform X2 [Ixodes scapularis]